MGYLPASWVLVGYAAWPQYTTGPGFRYSAEMSNYEFLRKHGLL